MADVPCPSCAALREEIAALKAAVMPDGVKCRDLGECMAQVRAAEEAERELEALKTDIAKWRESYALDLGAEQFHRKEAESALAALQDALKRMTNASYAEVRGVVERYRVDPTGLHRSYATDDEWALAMRVAAWFQQIAVVALKPQP
jgi:hypothetical protein